MNKINIRLILAITIVIPLNCIQKFDDVCRTSFSNSTQKIESTLNELKKEKNSNRNLASVSKHRYGEMEKLSRDQLKETQKYIDLAQLKSGLRPVSDELSSAAFGWAEFNGYASDGNLEKMISTLEEIQEHEKKAFELGCLK